MNIHLKKTISCICLLLICRTGFSQSNFYKFSAGAGFGPTVAYADLNEKSVRYGGYAELNFNFTFFVTAGIEVQIGQLKGGDPIRNSNGRAFTNNYQSATANVKLALGQLIDYSNHNFWHAVRGAYLGVGLGAIKNNLSAVVRYKPNTETPNSPLGYRFPGAEKSTNLLMPINAGINFYINDGQGTARYAFNLNYQTNLTFGEGLDGYNDPIGEFNNNAPDIYTLLSAGVKYNFGPMRSMRRHF